MSEGRLGAAFEIVFDSDLSESEIKAAFQAIADYYRACGGTGLEVKFEQEEAGVQELLHV
jgi:hypothetical protein